ncbi:CoA-acylating methylmalonate-semialdehyde dehydrogenase [Virgibacillus sp. NKC19-3]|uniref:CoA-acylating methylmalonate-semialdehyde dehydrogenase n=1 Tax=Virgibacillus saliphilus TaxID=2831674 RepID=UPI001C9B47B1|nr:CoA-acylating methylmalonate-semialdehyde dehydrogenase [Virgibacillus sp. NKC19-3]MBY7144282.1 CoA-acylating methylmalonate-semialdehyde dehydrogenase [Virgibacillus sp. NKC19-3]
MKTITKDEVTHFINGEKVKGKNNKYGYVYSPSTGQQIATVPYASAEEVDETVKSAKQAQKEWASTSLGKRAKVVQRFSELLTQHTEELARLIGKENGKTISDAKGEISRGIESVDLAMGVAQIVKGEHSTNVGGDINAYSIKQPLGVVTCISPFNFPVMVPLAMSTMAVAVGNAMILKPSEKVPQSAIRMSELWKEAGLPDGVWNVVNGDKDTVDAIITHKDVQAISFVGSTKVAEAIYETGTKHHKRVQAFGGGKNHMVIMPDVNLDKAVDAFIGAAYGSASQRCMAISVAMPVGEQTAKAFTEKLKAKVKDLKPGAFDDNNADFGAVISNEAKQNVLKAIDEAVDEGAQVIVDGRKPNVENEDGFYLGATLLGDVTPDMDVYKKEVFGPSREIVAVESLEEAIDAINEHEYGNGVSIFTNSGVAARKFTQEIEVGMVGVNVPIPIPVAYHNFGGWKGSRFGEGQMFGPDTARFFTKVKTVSERWFDDGDMTSTTNFNFPSSD